MAYACTGCCPCKQSSKGESREMFNLKAGYVSFILTLVLIALVGCTDGGGQSATSSDAGDFSTTAPPAVIAPPPPSPQAPFSLRGSIAGEAGRKPTALLNTRLGHLAVGGTTYVYKQLSAAGKHTCGILDTGVLRCWGRNTRGQLGVGDTLVHSGNVAANLPRNRTATFVSTGKDFTCAVLDDASLYCWGSNSRGQLGLGDTSDRRTPQRVLPHNFIISSVAAGDEHACAIMIDNDLYCWGRGSAGALGLGSLDDQLAPRRVLSNVEKVALGTHVTCAIVNSGTLPAITRCWGRNHYGELGIGNAAIPRILDANHSSALFPAGLTEVAAGHHFTCGIFQGGSAACWGRNHLKVLGNATADVDDAQTNTIVASGANKIAAGKDFVCVLRTDGRVGCWGANHREQLGRDTSQYYVDGSPGFVELPSGSVAKSITAGEGHACAILDAGRSYCWGWDDRGQLGVQVREIPSVLNPLHTGLNHTCALLTNGKLYCWGRNDHGQLGQGDLSGDGKITSADVGPVYESSRKIADHRYRYTPGRETQLSNVPQGVRVVSVVGGHRHTCAILDNGKSQCWGQNDRGQLGVDYLTFPEGGVRHYVAETDGNAKHPVPWNTNVLGSTDKVRSFAGANHTCAVLAGGDLRCWGKNDYGEAGATAGQPMDVLIPRAIDLGVGEKAVSVAVGSDHSCVLLSSGLVKCWGDNARGQLGPPAGTVSIAVRTIRFGTPTKTVDLTSRFKPACSVQANNDVYCWGDNSLAVGLASRYQHTCAVLVNGDVYCWGDNSSFQVSQENPVRVYTPNKIDLGEAAIAVSTGESHSCAVLESGRVACWGRRQGFGTQSASVTHAFPVEIEISEQAILISSRVTKNRHICIDDQNPNGSRFSDGAKPTCVKILDQIVGISSGKRHTCVMTAQGAVYCWGDNSGGQLGMENAARSNIPKKVNLPN